MSNKKCCQLRLWSARQWCVYWVYKSVLCFMFVLTRDSFDANAIWVMQGNWCFRECAVSLKPKPKPEDIIPFEAGKSCIKLNTGPRMFYNWAGSYFTFQHLVKRNRRTIVQKKSTHKWKSPLLNMLNKLRSKRRIKNAEAEFIRENTHRNKQKTEKSTSKWGQ